jgi:BCD family chlorophyll transporter-like MFS transporter
MGVFGAAQAMGFGLGGVLGAVGVDALRAALAQDARAFAIVFCVEAGLFLAAAVLAWRLGAPVADSGAAQPAFAPSSAASAALPREAEPAR